MSLVVKLLRYTVVVSTYTSHFSSELRHSQVDLRRSVDTGSYRLYGRISSDQISNDQINSVPRLRCGARSTMGVMGNIQKELKMPYWN